MGRVAPNFHIWEFVPPRIYRQFGDKKSIWYIRPEIINLAQFYRDWWDAPVIINTWYNGGIFSQRGFRTPNTSTGALYSQHKLGAAFDCHIRGISANRMRRDIMDNATTFRLQGLTTLESGSYAPTWVHSDIRPTGLPQDKILIVKPRKAA